MRLIIAFGMGALAGMACLTAALRWDGTASRPPAAGRGLTVEVLASYCSGCAGEWGCHGDEVVGRSFCQGVIGGVLGSRPELAGLCLPEGWDNGHARRLFLAWERRHPESHGWPASEGILRAHAASFACPGDGRRGDGV